MGPHLKFLHMTKISPRTMSVASATNIRYEDKMKISFSQSHALRQEQEILSFNLVLRDKTNSRLDNSFLCKPCSGVGIYGAGQAFPGISATFAAAAIY